MKKILILLVFILLFSGCMPQKELWDYRPMIYFNDAFYGETNTVLSSLPEGWTETSEVEKNVPSHEPPPEENRVSNSLNAGTPLYTNADSPELIYAEIGENKFIAYVLIEEKYESDAEGGDITSVPLVNIDGTRWIVSDYKSGKAPNEKDIIGIIDSYSNYAFEHGQTNLIGCVGQPYAFLDGVYYVYTVNYPFQNENYEFYNDEGWLECHTDFGNPNNKSSASTASKSEISGYENPYSDCVPEWSVSSHSSDPSYVHSTDTSSNISAQN